MASHCTHCTDYTTHCTHYSTHCTYCTDYTTHHWRGHNTTHFSSLHTPQHFAIQSSVECGTKPAGTYSSVEQSWAQSGKFVHVAVQASLRRKPTEASLLLPVQTSPREPAEAFVIMSEEAFFAVKNNEPICYIGCSKSSDPFLPIVSIHQKVLDAAEV